jgi:hypothetical protein
MANVQARFVMEHPRYVASGPYWLVEGYVNNSYRNFCLHAEAKHPKLGPEVVLVVDEDDQIWIESDLKRHEILEAKKAEKEWKKDPMSTIIRGHASIPQLLRLWGTLIAIVGLPFLWAWWQVTR